MPQSMRVAPYVEPTWPERLGESALNRRQYIHVTKQRGYTNRKYVASRQQEHSFEKVIRNTNVNQVFMAPEIPRMPDGSKGRHARSDAAYQAQCSPFRRAEPRTEEHKSSGSTGSDDLYRVRSVLSHTISMNLTIDQYRFFKAG